MITQRRKAYYWGLVAEWWCMAWLILKGYSILAHRFKHAQGEIDIIAFRAGSIIFVEVKARNQLDAALSAITAEKKHRTQQAALAYMALHRKQMTHDLRFDVMVVTSRLRIHHIINAWSNG